MEDKMQDDKWAAIAERFKALYVPAVCDVLDDLGLRFQFMHHSLTPLESSSVIAGPAFTIVGAKSAEPDPRKRLGPKVVDAFTAGVVAVYATNNDEQTGVWGELWAAGAVARGCVGAVVDGGIRDSRFIRDAGFPIFRRFHSPADAVGRFTVVDHNCSVAIAGVMVHPGDYIFGDEDGIAVIPQALTMEVLEQAEAVRDRETLIRADIAEGGSLSDLYYKHGKF
jgi:4-hydroxy-4-methyl-2-oxoglutarate aldolase